MEFFQFHPTALILPGVPVFLVSEAVRGEGGLLRNNRGERFMSKYHDMAELAPRDVVARSIVAGVSTKLKGYNASPWTADPRDIANWYLEE